MSWIRVPWASGFTLVLYAAMASCAWGDSAVEQLHVYPVDIHLTATGDTQRFIVIATRADGVTRDVTDLAAVHIKDSALVKCRQHVVHPVRDGSTELTATFAGKTATARIEVAGATRPRPISFELDVMPVFLRAGCNTGSCHGAASGKEGFRLSLFGFDAKGDYFRITREIGFRRVNLAVPERSLLIEKATGQVPHGGGKRFAIDSPYNQTLLRWLEAGAPADDKAVPAVVALDIFPPAAVIEGKGSTLQFLARARYADGTDRDVTDLVVFRTNNDNSATVSADGLVTVAARGEAFITARFDTKTEGSQVIVLPKDVQYTPPAVTGNYIDTLVGAKLQRLRILPSAVCTDEEFLRRVSLDIVGLLPTEDEYRQFMSDANPAKRGKLVDRLLQRKEFAEIWAMKWAELLMVKSSNQVSYKSMFLYSSWLTNQIANGVPLDKMVRDLLSASGGTFKNPATNFYQIERDTKKTAENVAQVFLGIRTQCSQCHNHPFDRWTMDDYYSFAAFFSQIGRKPGEDYRETIVFNRGGGEIRNPVTNKVMQPKPLGDAVPDTKGKDRREVLAQWLTSPKNPYFATSVANRIWAHFFAVGIVDPVDDIRVSNPPSNPELFRVLGDKLVEYKFDFKKLVRDICNSQAYQRSGTTNATNVQDTLNFAHATPRRLPAETLLDCISQVTNTQDKFRGLPLGARAVQIADGRTSNYFLTTFGRAARDTVGVAEVSTDPSLSQALNLLNGPTVYDKIRRGGTVKKMLADGAKPGQIIQAIFIRALTRPPTPDEAKQVLAIAGQSGNMQAGLEDVFWAVLNSREFIFNH